MLRDIQNAKDIDEAQIAAKALELNYGAKYPMRSRRSPMTSTPCWKSTNALPSTGSTGTPPTPPSPFATVRLRPRVARFRITRSRNCHVLQAHRGRTSQLAQNQLTRTRRPRPGPRGLPQKANLLDAALTSTRTRCCPMTSRISTRPESTDRQLLTTPRRHWAASIHHPAGSLLSKRQGAFAALARRSDAASPNPIEQTGVKRCPARSSVAAAPISTGARARKLFEPSWAMAAQRSGPTVVNDARDRRRANLTGIVQQTPLPTADLSTSNSGLDISAAIRAMRWSRPQLKVPR